MKIEFGATVILMVLGFFGFLLFSLQEEISAAGRIIIIVITIAVVLSILALAGLFLWSAYQRGHAEREKRLAEAAMRRRAEAEADKAEVEGQAQIVTAKADEAVYLLQANDRYTAKLLHLNPARRINGASYEPSPDELHAWRLWQMAHGTRPAAPPMASANIVEGQALPAPDNQANTLAAIEKAECCLIVGPRDAGKTTMLQWAIDRRKITSDVLVIDPHAYADKWPGCVTVGTGRNYDQIERALKGLLMVMDKRFREIGNGAVIEGSHKKLTVIIDEWRAIVKNIDGAGEAIGALLTESRKVTMTMFLATHSERVKALGLDGEGDLKDGFTIIRLSKIGEERRATIDWGDGEIPANLPGPYPDGSSQPTADDLAELFALPDLSATTEPAEPAVDEDAAQDAEFVRLVREEGKSKSEAARLVFNRDYAGSSFVNRCRRALGEIPNGDKPTASAQGDSRHIPPTTTQKQAVEA